MRRSGLGCVRVWRMLEREPGLAAVQLCAFILKTPSSAECFARTIWDRTAQKALYSTLNILDAFHWPDQLILSIVRLIFRRIDMLLYDSSPASWRSASLEKSS